MVNSKSTKRALVTSALAILMCVAMLIGTTFAWFTDTASTGVNKIQAGNLKMQVTYKNENSGNEPAILDENTNVFKEDTLWEPGHVEFAVLNVKNVGTLALKYKLGINIASETGSTNVNGKEFKLSDYIKFAVIDGDQSALGRTALLEKATDSKLIKEGYTKESHLDTTGANETVTLVVWMPETVGNEANHAVDAAAPVINLGIDVVATQYTYEKDSFDDQYDKDATYPVKNAQDLKKALEEVNASETVDSAILVVTDDFSYGNETLAVHGGKDITIDLAGKSLTIANAAGDGLEVGEGKLTLANSGSSGTYIFDCTSGNSDGIFVHNTEEGKTASVTVAANVEIRTNANSNSAIHAYGEKGEAVVNIEEGAKVTVTGTSKTSAIIVDQNATLNINGGEFSMNADFDSYSDGNDVVGILLWGQNGKQENSTVNINGGTFKVGGKNAFAQGIQIGMKNGYSNNLAVNMKGGAIILAPTENGKGYAFTTYKDVYGKFAMSGGTVSGTVDALALAYIGKTDLTVTGGAFSIDPSGYVDMSSYAVTESAGIWSVTKK